MTQPEPFTDPGLTDLATNWVATRRNPADALTAARHGLRRFGLLGGFHIDIARFEAAIRADTQAALLDRVRQLETERDRYRTAWHSAKTRASNLRERLDNADHGLACTGETIEQLQATLDQMPRCNTPHPTVDEAWCELIIQHPGWHAAQVGAWPHASWPRDPQS
ncbi:hypothetical protein [Streptomyces sp. LS1784]|uniref:hypothetical protein n=1 Tax=Streptomyces sp. LS1784 TaxID=2851533 RepID=UPI001CCA89F0|nr:hypothetical protein [Streptomyces sp. LS1784]